MAIKHNAHIFLVFATFGKSAKNKWKPYMYTSRDNAEKYNPEADIVEYSPFYSGSWERIGKDYVECKHCGTLYSITDDVNAGSNKWKFCPACGSQNIWVNEV